MTASSYRLEASWPIVDHEAPLAALKDEALTSLTAALAAAGARRAGRPTFHITHGPKPSLSLSVPVLAPADTAGAIAMWAGDAYSS